MSPHWSAPDLDTAARPLVGLGGLEPNSARGDALRYTTWPTQPSSHLLGRDRSVALRDQVLRRGVALADFDAWLLGHGSVPPHLILAGQ